MAASGGDNEPEEEVVVVGWPQSGHRLGGGSPASAMACIRGAERARAGEVENGLPFRFPSVASGCLPF